jgi:periplasmic divalent cation tolerance protein
MSAEADEKIVVLSTAANIEEANNITLALLEARKVACVNIVPEVQSKYWWQGKIAQDREILLIAKTKRSALPDVIKIIKDLHSYETPEVIALPVIGGSAQYLAWLDDQLK